MTEKPNAFGNFSLLALALALTGCSSDTSKQALTESNNAQGGTAQGGSGGSSPTDGGSEHGAGAGGHSSQGGGETEGEPGEGGGGGAATGGGGAAGETAMGGGGGSAGETAVGGGGGSAGETAVGGGGGSAGETGSGGAPPAETQVCEWFCTVEIELGCLDRPESVAVCVEDCGERLDRKNCRSEFAAMERCLQPFPDGWKCNNLPIDPVPSMEARLECGDEMDAYDRCLWPPPAPGTGPDIELCERYCQARQDMKCDEVDENMTLCVWDICERRAPVECEELIEKELTCDLESYPESWGCTELGFAIPDYTKCVDERAAVSDCRESAM